MIWKLLVIHFQMTFIGTSNCLRNQIEFFAQPKLIAEKPEYFRKYAIHTIQQYFLCDSSELQYIIIFDDPLISTLKFICLTQYLPMDKDSIEEVAKKTLSWPSNRKWDSTDKNSRFSSFFGAPSEIVAELWNRTEPTVNEPGAEPKHLLWALLFLKLYSTEEVHCCLTGWPSVRTFRKWSWYFIAKISELKGDVIRLERRFEGNPAPNIRGFMTVDGTDCPVFEPRPFDTKMFSHKFNGPGLKYEVAVCIKTGFIVWTNGPFKAGTPDQTIFNNALSHEIGDNEIVEVDGGYVGTMKGRMPTQGIDSKERKQKSIARGRHEIVNGRLKQFSVLTTHFRHMGKNTEEMMQKHKLCFDAVTVVTQLKFDAGMKTFDVEYDVDYSVGITVEDVLSH